MAGISTNLGEFLQQLASFNRKHRGATTMRMRAMARYALRQCILYTPIDTGRLVASWRLSIGDVDGSTSPLGRRSAEAARAEGLSTLSRADAVRVGDTLYISNSVSYAEYIENGSPTTKPRRMTARALRDIISRFGP